MRDILFHYDIPQRITKRVVFASEFERGGRIRAAWQDAHVLCRVEGGEDIIDVVVGLDDLLGVHHGDILGIGHGGGSGWEIGDYVVIEAQLRQEVETFGPGMRDEVDEADRFGNFFVVCLKSWDMRGDKLIRDSSNVAAG